MIHLHCTCNDYHGLNIELQLFNIVCLLDEIHPNAVVFFIYIQETKESKRKEHTI